jgi:hypothetical protein
MKKIFNPSTYVTLTLLAYVIVQSFAVSAPAFVADDMQELTFVNGLDAVWKLAGSDAFGLFRPIKNILFFLFARLSASDLCLARMISIAIGVMSYFPVRAFFKRMQPEGAFGELAAAVWLLAPTLVSSVAWLSCVNIQVMCIFVALSFVLHDKSYPVLSAASIFLACSSYEAAVVIGPGIVLFDMLLRNSRIRQRRTWVAYAVYAGITVLYMLLRWLGGSATSVNGSFANTTRLDIMLAAAYFTWQHFISWLFPFGRMSAFGGYVGGSVHWSILVSAYIALFAWGAAGMLLWRKRPVLAFGMIFSVGAFIPLGNFAGLGNGPYGDYYLALSGMGLSVALTDAAIWGISSRKISAVAFGCGVLLILSRVVAVPEAARWAALWADSDKALISGVEAFPQAFANHIFLAQRCCDRGMYSDALMLCREVESMIGSESEQYAQICWIRALVDMNGERNAESALWWIDRGEALSRQPRGRRLAHYYRGCVAEDLQGNLDLAEREFEKALPSRLGVDDIRTADRLARLLAIKGEVGKAVVLWREALRVSPGDYGVMVNLSIALREIGCKQESEELRIRAQKVIGVR